MIHYCILNDIPVKIFHSNGLNCILQQDFPCVQRKCIAVEDCLQFLGHFIYIWIWAKYLLQHDDDDVLVLKLYH